MVNKGIHQGVAVVSGSRMDNHPGRFVHDHYRIVFVYDVKRNILRCDVLLVKRKIVDFQEISRFDYMTRFGIFPVYANQPGVDHFLDRCSGMIVKQIGNKFIEPFQNIVFADGVFVCRFPVSWHFACSVVAPRETDQSKAR